MSARFCILPLSLFIVAGVFISDNFVSAGSCEETNVMELISQCKNYVLKSGPKSVPSRGCCAVVKTVDVPCACKLVTKEIEQIISMEKVIFVAKSCGKKIPSGTKCGSYIVRSA